MYLCQINKRSDLRPCRQTGILSTSRIQGNVRTEIGEMNETLTSIDVLPFYQGVCTNRFKGFKHVSPHKHTIKHLRELDQKNHDIYQYSLSKAIQSPLPPLLSSLLLARHTFPLPSHCFYAHPTPNGTTLKEQITVKVPLLGPKDHPPSSQPESQQSYRNEGG